MTDRLLASVLGSALEYERTPKKSREYLQIRNLLEQENRIYRFVYIVPEQDLGSFIVECFSGTRIALYVGLAAEFTESFKEMRIIEASYDMTRWVAAAL